MSQRFTRFGEFYPFYLGEHANINCRRLHFIGSWLVIFIIIVAWLQNTPTILWLVPVAGYGCAWAGHFFFEHNRPATFQYPLWSFMGDWVMLKDFLTGRLHPAKSE